MIIIIIIMIYDNIIILIRDNINNILVYIICNMNFK